MIDGAVLSTSESPWREDEPDGHGRGPLAYNCWLKINPFEATTSPTPAQ